MALARDSVLLLAVLASCAEVQGRRATFRTVCCGADGHSCCGVGWMLHCCNPEQSTCCLGENRIPARGHRIHKHGWDYWEWDHDDWLPVTLVVILCVVIISCTLLCCCRRNRPSHGLRHEFRVLPHYKYGAIPPQTALATDSKQHGISNAHVAVHSAANAPPPPYSEAGWA